MNDQVKLVIDKYLNEWENMGLNLFNTIEYQDMVSGSSELGKTWKPIKSTVTDLQLDSLEQAIGYQLPTSFKNFLKYKHFIELHIGDIEFFSHPSKDWKKHILDPIFDGYPTEFLIDKGIMPFANYSDWGLVCFDLKNMTGNESSVFLWDHERPEDFELIYPDFDSMIIKIDKQLRIDNET